MNRSTLNDLIAGAGLDAQHAFSAPWEARAFAIARGLSDAGHFSWDEFRAHLIAEVARADRVRERDGTADRGEYYENFLRALEAIVTERKIVGAAEIARKLREIAQ
jgi:nitrile hydratase accessory protein